MKALIRQSDNRIIDIQPEFPHVPSGSVVVSTNLNRSAIGKVYDLENDSVIESLPSNRGQIQAEKNQIRQELKGTKPEQSIKGLAERIEKLEKLIL